MSKALTLAAVTGVLPGRPYDPKKSTMRKHMWRASAQQAEYWVSQGMITDYEFRAYKLASTWCSPRFGGDALRVSPIPPHTLFDSSYKRLTSLSHLKQRLKKEKRDASH